jgi:hypothetical protein
VAIAAPNDPPTVRMTVLMPVAIPTSDCGTAATMRFAIAANAKEMPAPRSAPAARISIAWACATARTTNDADVSPAPVARTARKPIRVPRRPASAPVASWASAAGSRSSPATVTEEPKP